MTRRQAMLMTVLGPAGLRLAAMATCRAVGAEESNEQEAHAAFIKNFGTAKISLQQGLTASEQEGRPISGKFELDDGKLQLSVYTAKDGKFFEVIVDHATGKVLKVEPITEGDDLTTAKAHSAALAKAKISLEGAIDKAAGEAAGSRVVAVAPSVKSAHPVASVLLLKGDQFKSVDQQLD
jgi:uncharacterized membrane protein YkoI